MINETTTSAKHSDSDSNLWKSSFIRSFITVVASSIDVLLLVEHPYPWTILSQLWPSLKSFLSNATKFGHCKIYSKFTNTRRRSVKNRFVWYAWKWNDLVMHELNIQVASDDGQQPPRIHFICYRKVIYYNISIKLPGNSGNSRLNSEHSTFQNAYDFSRYVIEANQRYAFQHSESIIFDQNSFLFIMFPILSDLLYIPFSLIICSGRSNHHRTERLMFTLNADRRSDFHNVFFCTFIIGSLCKIPHIHIFKSLCWVNISLHITIQNE